MYDILESIDQERKDFDALTSSLDRLGHVHYAIRSGGMNPTAYAIMKSTGLLSSVSLSGMAMESITTEIALESILNKIKETAAKWSAKILDTLKSIANKVFDVVNPIYTKIKEKFKVLKEGTFNATKATSVKIKAHPYATVTAAIAAVAAVVAIVIYATGHFPKMGSSSSVLESFNNKLKGMMSKIKSPFCKIVVEKTDIVSVKVVKETVAKVEGTASSMGWTDSSISSMMASTDKMMGDMNRHWKEFADKGMALSKATVPLASSAIAKEDFSSDEENPIVLFFKIIGKIFMSLYYIVKAVVVICLEVIKQILSVLGIAYERTSLAHY